MSLVKLVEVCGRGKHYNPETERCDTEYSLREVYINPAYISMIREDEMHLAEHQRGKLVDGLSEEQTFSKLFLESLSIAIIVVGNPETIIDKIRDCFDD